MGRAKTKARRHDMNILSRAHKANIFYCSTVIRALLLVLSCAASADGIAQPSVTLNFDGLADGVFVTSQYAAQGVTVSGATAFAAASAGVPAHSGQNVVYAGTGLMSFQLGSSLGQVKKVSAYITGPTNVGLFAYDSANTLLGSSVMASNGTNVVLSFTSTGNAIARVDIHDGGASFFVDDVTFTGSSQYALKNLGLGLSAGTVQPQGTNAQGQVAGVSANLNGDPRAFFYNGTSIQDIGTLGGKYAAAAAINSAGRVVGNAGIANGAMHAFSWTAGSGMVDLGSLGGGIAYANAVNASGTVVGVASLTLLKYHGFAWTQGGGMTDLGSFGGPLSYASDINSAGQIVGYATVPAGWPHAFVRTGSSMTDLGLLPGAQFSYATRINDHGQVIGGATVANGRVSAFFWTAANGMVNIGTLGGKLTIANDINQAGQVVGSSTDSNGNARAFFWAGGALTNLGTLGGKTSSANAISGSGQIVGTADTANGERHAFVWTQGTGMVDLNNRMQSAPAGLVLTGALAISDRGEMVATSNAGLMLIGGNSSAPVVGPIVASVRATVGAAVDFKAAFTDVDASDSHSATWSWGDGSLAQAATVTESAGTGNATRTHVFSKAGVYPVSLKVTDTTGQVAQVSTEIVVTKK
ncbi:PKD domain-containing protein [Paraburkholderia ginsengisoli]|nr:PKD domain-containing protein [Paraburkholderia ginsengisoli]